MPVNVLLVLLVSGGVGFVSGLVGVGGGFIMTPSLIFLGVPAPVAVATGASQIAATSFSGIMTQTRRKSVDWRMGLLLSIGGIVGSTLGVWLFERLLRLGQLDLIVSVLYLLLLAGVGWLMLAESIAVIRGRSSGAVTILRRPARTIAHQLPFRMRFPRSGLYISVIPPLALGFFIGALAAVMGVGGGFILIPAMIYLLRMPTNVVVGTSLFQVLVVTVLIVILQSTATQTVDLVLAALLMVGGVVGAQFGARLGAGLKGEHIRALLGLLLLAASAKFAADIVIPPAEMYTLGGGQW
ncbi:MAG: sulfite exporter TauE/SafE family protein [Hyphomonadaceae bacterium]|nr:sulfite exporter TauE/SafE family protein [Hyphomonadaceae bacterium]MBX3510575.1 sulfite exporter TauE/SafE family protein [Hyphomonadaceae bacterium]